MKSVSNYICKTLLLLLLPFSVSAQQGQAQKALEKIGEVEKANKFLPSAIRIGGEVGNYAYSYIDDNIDKQWEFTADVDFHKYFLVVDYGYTSFDMNEAYFDYNSTGNYLRIGPDINFIKKKRRNNVLFLGLRYARSSFDEEVIYSTSNAIQQQEVWPESTVTENFTGVNARWYELNTGLRVNVLSNFYMGFTLRYKFAFKTLTEKTFRTYYAPGYGKNVDKKNFGVSYYIYYRLQFREKYKTVFQK